MSTPTEDEWPPEDFVVSIEALSDPPVGVELHAMTGLEYEHESRLSPFVGTDLQIELENVLFDDDFNYVGRATCPETSLVVRETVLGLMRRLAKGREWLTLVRRRLDWRKEYDGLEREDDLVAGDEYQTVPPVRRGLFRRMKAYVAGDIWDKPPDVLLTTRQPWDIPDFHLRNVLSLLPRPSQRDALCGRLLHGGIQSFDQRDFSKCRLLIQSSFTGGDCEHAFVDVIHPPEDADFVWATMYAVAGEVGVRVYPEWRLGDIELGRTCSGRTGRIPPGSPLAAVGLLEKPFHILVRPFRQIGLRFHKRRGVEEPFTTLVRRQSQELNDWTSSLVECLANGRSLLTVVGDLDRGPAAKGSCGDPSYQAIPAANPRMWRQILSILRGRRGAATTSLYLTRKPPSEIPEYHVKSVVTICARRGQEEAIHQTLVREGFYGLGDHLLNGCDFFFLPEFRCEDPRQVPFVSVIGQGDDIASVGRAMDIIAARPDSSLRRLP